MSDLFRYLKRVEADLRALPPPLKSIVIEPGTRPGGYRHRDHSWRISPKDWAALKAQLKPEQVTSRPAICLPWHPFAVPVFELGKWLVRGRDESPGDTPSPTERS